MKNYQLGIRIAGLGALALGLTLAGCGGGSPVGSTGGAGMMPGQNVVPPGVAQVNQGGADMAGLTSPDKRHHHHHGGYCAPVSIQQNFNGQAIARGSWLLFTSAVQFPGNQGAARVEMKDSQVVLNNGVRQFKIKGPNMTFTMNGTGRVRLKFAPGGGKPFGGSGGWTMLAPENTSGQDFMNDIAYRVSRSLPGNIQNVTWSAKFYSRSYIKQLQWQWGAAVYQRLSKSYGRLGIKPLDDQKYPPFNNDKAGTPERYKGWLENGGTGGGGNNYTGMGGPNQNLTPCY